MASVMDIVATADVVKERLTVRMDMDNPITHKQYLMLHPYLLKGEAVRFCEIRDAPGKDLKELLRTKTMPVGYYVKSRKEDSAGKYFYSDGETLWKIPMRY